MFLLDNGFNRGNVHKTLFIKQEKKHISIAQVYVDDIVSGSTSDNLIDKSAKSMSRESE